MNGATTFDFIAKSLLTQKIEKKKVDSDSADAEKRTNFIKLFNSKREERTVPNPFCKLSRILFFGGNPSWTEIKAIASEEPQSLAADVMKEFK